jgi:hypothetical protein
MTTAHQLARILASRTDAGITLTLETDTGQIFSVLATAAQASALMEEVRVLLAREAAGD